MILTQFQRVVLQYLCESILLLDTSIVQIFIIIFFTIRFACVMQNIHYIFAIFKIIMHNPCYVLKAFSKEFLGDIKSKLKTSLNQSQFLKCTCFSGNNVENLPFLSFGTVYFFNNS